MTADQAERTRRIIEGLLIVAIGVSEAASIGDLFVGGTGAPALIIAAAFAFALIVFEATIFGLAYWWFRR